MVASHLLAVAESVVVATGSNNGYEMAKRCGGKIGEGGRNLKDGEVVLGW